MDGVFNKMKGWDAGVPNLVKVAVANAKFSLLKLLIYEPYYCYALVGWSARPRLEP